MAKNSYGILSYRIKVVDMIKFKLKKAFSLAEVLLTMVIVGAISIDEKIFTNEHIPYSDIDKISFSRGAQNVLSFTILEATRLRSAQASSQHLLLALCKVGSSYGSTYLNDLGVDYGHKPFFRHLVQSRLHTDGSFL